MKVVVFRIWLGNVFLRWLVVFVMWRVVLYGLLKLWVFVMLMVVCRKKWLRRNVIVNSFLMVW